jgi:hypothetical protein
VTKKGDGIFSAVLWPESSVVAIETMCVFFWGAAEADETIECETYNSIEHNQVAEVLNEINAQFAVRIKKWGVQESLE